MLKSGIYSSSNTSSIFSTSFGSSGGNTVCKNISINNINVTTISSITGIGNYQVQCTATSNAGKSVTKIGTYNLVGIFNSSYYLACTTFSNIDYCRTNETSLIIPGPKNNDDFSVSAQYGPYFKIQSGCYKIIYNGNNLDNREIIYEVYQSNPNIKYNILALTTTNDTASYYINITDSLLNNNWDSLNKASGIEFSLYNYSTVDIIVNSITVQYVDSCPTS